MTDLRQTRTHTSTRTRSRSRPSRPGSPKLHRLLSNQFPDDHSVYHHEDGEGVHVRSDAASLQKTETQRRRGEALEDDSDSASSSDTSLSEKNNETTPVESEETTTEEIRAGIPNERDVEAQAPQLKEKKSSRSVKDPNLVGSLQMFAVCRKVTCLSWTGWLGRSR
jgi:hypothetical protein